MSHRKPLLHHPWRCVYETGVAPGVFRAFQYTGDMIVIGVRDFLFDRDDIRQMLFKYNIKLTDSEINEMLKESIGYPLGVAATLQCINHADGQRVYNSDIKMCIRDSIR